MIDWSAGYSCEISVNSVNKETWASTEELANVVSASITRSATDDVPLLEQASLEVDGDIPTGWYRISMLVRQGGVERVTLGTFLVEKVSRVDSYGRTTYTANGWSVLKPADRQTFIVGDYAPAGVDGASYVASMLRECIPAPVAVNDSFTLGDDIVFAPGTTKLAAAWKVLKAGGFIMQIGADGTVNIGKKPDSPSMLLDRAGSVMLMPEVSGGVDTSDIPNRYFANDGKQVVSAMNTDPESEVSYQSRGMWVDCYDSSPKRVNGETLSAYAERRLREMSSVTKQKSYTREYDPDVLPLSMVRCALPELDLVGDGFVMSQSLSIGYGVTVNETLGFEVQL